jgi:hypothetical protein
MTDTNIFIILRSLPNSSVNSNGVVSGQKISKFFVSHMEKYMTGQVNVNGVY